MTFRELDLREGALRRVDLVDCVLEDCNFAACALQRCSLEDVILRRCDLGMATVAETAFRNVRFVDCRLTGVDWSRAHDLTFEVSFEDCVLDMASFTGLRLRGLSFGGGRARDAAFSGCDLRDAVFERADLRGAVFTGNDLRGADLSSCDGLVLRPDGNRLRGTRLPLDTAVDLLTQLGVVVPALGR